MAGFTTKPTLDLTEEDVLVEKLIIAQSNLRNSQAELDELTKNWRNVKVDLRLNIALVKSNCETVAKLKKQMADKGYSFAKYVP